jgi:hypothetical protein
MRPSRAASYLDLSSMAAGNHEKLWYSQDAPKTRKNGLKPETMRVPSAFKFRAEQAAGVLYSARGIDVSYPEL